MELKLLKRNIISIKIIWKYLFNRLKDNLSSHYIKFGYCDEDPSSIWRKYRRGDASISVPRILGRIRIALKFMNAAIKKHLSTSELHAIVLDSNASVKDIMKEDESSGTKKENEVREKQNLGYFMLQKNFCIITFTVIKNHL